MITITFKRLISIEFDLNSGVLKGKNSPEYGNLGK